ncbi:MAG: hypothetical protein ACJA16_005321, partial [Akkermansiaceae bacterium]
ENQYSATLKTFRIDTALRAVQKNIVKFQSIELFSGAGDPALGLHVYFP